GVELTVSLVRPVSGNVRGHSSKADESPANRFDLFSIHSYLPRSTLDRSCASQRQLAGAGPGPWPSRNAWTCGGPAKGCHRGVRPLRHIAIAPLSARGGAQRFLALGGVSVGRRRGRSHIHLRYAFVTFHYRLRTYVLL